MERKTKSVCVGAEMRGRVVVVVEGREERIGKQKLANLAVSRRVHSSPGPPDPEHFQALEALERAHEPTRALGEHVLGIGSGGGTAASTFRLDRGGLCIFSAVAAVLVVVAAAAVAE